jgi:hypothetical protein
MRRFLVNHYHTGKDDRLEGVEYSNGWVHVIHVGAGTTSLYKDGIYGLCLDRAIETQEIIWVDDRHNMQREVN